ncbi:MAG: error-prone DNA polymerase [Paralcaligenes sp.]
MKTPALPLYAELDCLSNFSFLKGASHPEELVQRAAQLGYQALAMADECSLSGIVRAYTEAKQHAIKLIIGSRFFLENSLSEIIILACNRNGYGNLSELITLARAHSVKGNYFLSLSDLLEARGPLAHLKNLPDCLVIFKPDSHLHPPAWSMLLEPLLNPFKGRLWLGLTRHHHHDDAPRCAGLQQQALHLGIPLVAAGGVEMHRRSRQPLHDTLTAIRLKQPISDCGYGLKPNAEHHLRSLLRLAALYTESALQETLEISRRCTFSLDEIRYEYPIEIIPEGHTVKSYLRQETYAGAQKRYPNGPSDKVRRQLETELGIISDLGYEPYFLTVYDIVLYARRSGILCQGRGSAANSAVCYCLGITEVEPEHSHMLFARFISPERKEPPDIDVDFEHQRREEVIQYIYQKYGRQRAALTAVVTTYRTRSALRDTGKALGLDLDLIARVTHSFQHWDSKQTLHDKIAEHGLDRNSRVTVLWAELTQTIIGFPRHLSQHPGGFVISRDKLSRLTPIENAAMPDRSVVQWDKDDLDAMGLLKIDVLALGMLSALKRALALVGWRRAQAFTMQDVSREDEATYDMICQADTIGVFQIESRAQMSMLPRLRPRKFYDLVVQVAIVRPGPIQGGMVHPYLRRRQGMEPVSYPHRLEPVLSRTLGIPIFQEQVMQIAITAAGFSDGEADQLRRSMAAWRRKGGIDKFHARFVSGMLAHDYSEEFAQALFKQLEGFGEYGFPESHAASFAILAYISAWIKCHEPEAFLVALLNSQPMGFYSARQLVQDARKHHVHVLPVDIVTSLQEASFEQSSDPATTGSDLRPAVRLGFNLIKGLSCEAGVRIEAARKQRPFVDTHDLALRAALSRHDMDALAAADALRQLSGHRRLARWQAANAPFKDLLRPAPIADTVLPDLPTLTEGQSTFADYQTLGLTLGRHPLALLRPILQARRFISAADLLRDYPDHRLARACGIVTMRQRPQTAKGVVFVSLEDETGMVNVIVRPELAQRQHLELLQACLLGVYGIWQSHQGISHLVASRLVDLSELLEGLTIKSRNFH